MYNERENVYLCNNMYVYVTTDKHFINVNYNIQKLNYKHYPHTMYKCV